MTIRRSLLVVALAATAAVACSGPQPQSRRQTSAGPAAAVPAEGRSAERRADGAPPSDRALRAAAKGASTMAGDAPAGRKTIGDGNLLGGPSSGVTDDEIEVVYYWKGDRTRTSPFLRGTGAESNVDEAEAFRTWIDWINANPRGELMGFRYNLHGRKLAGEVVEAGSSAEDYPAAIEYIRGELKPFAALASHGSVSAYVCPFLAQAGIFNLATYDLDFGIADRSDGWCLPAAASFDAQVDAVVGYMDARSKGRRVGFLYAEYPGLVDSAPRVVQRLKAAGVNVVSTATMSASLTQAQQQAPGVVEKFDRAEVDLVVSPDAGAPLSFTHAAQAAGYRPDYMVWPCSGQDQTAMVRLFNGDQWSRATGLTCYDAKFMYDLAHEAPSKAQEWYSKYKSMGRGEPPAPAPYVYAGLLPLLVGVTGAGPGLNSGSFRDALAQFDAYRYDAENGRSTDARWMLMGLGRPARPLIADFSVLSWSSTRRRPGASLLGDYVFPERGKRYAATDRF